MKDDEGGGFTVEKGINILPNWISLARAVLIAALTAASAESLGKSTGTVDAAAVDPASLWRQAKQGDFVALEKIQVFPHKARCLISAERTALRLDHSAVKRNLACFQALHVADPATEEVAAEVEAGSAFAAGDYGTAARAARIGTSLAKDLQRPQDAAELTQTAAVSELLALQPRQRLASGSARAIRATRDVAGLMRVPTNVNGLPLDMIVDTGANLSVVSSSAAKKLGLRIVDGDASVGSSTRAAVGVRIGLADHFEVGGLVFENVAFLVLDDRDLSPSSSLAYRIDGIIGFPIFAATNGFTFESDGTFTPAPPVKPGARVDLKAIGSDLFVETKAGGRYASLHLDSGASTTALSWLFAERYPDLITTASRRTMRAAGAGGETQTAAAQLPSLDLALGSETFQLDKVSVQLQHDSTPAPFGTLGQDVLRRASWYGVDLRTMSLVLGPKLSV